MNKPLEYVGMFFIALAVLGFVFIVLPALMTSGYAWNG